MSETSTRNTSDHFFDGPASTAHPLASNASVSFLAFSTTFVSSFTGHWRSNNLCLHSGARNSSSQPSHLHTVLDSFFVAPPFRLLVLILSAPSSLWLCPLTSLFHPRTSFHHVILSVVSRPDSVSLYLQLGPCLCSALCFLLCAHSM